MGSSEHSDKKAHITQVDINTVDVAAEITAGSEGILDAAEAARIRCLIFSMIRWSNTQINLPGGRSTGTSFHSCAVSLPFNLSFS